MPLFAVDRHVGFSGTRAGLESSRRKLIRQRLEELRLKDFVWFHHGDCVGADEEVAKIAKALGYKLWCHPSNLKQQRAFVESDIVEDECSPLTRNKHIVNMSELLIAAPYTTTEELRSGTWSTIRYARSVGKPAELY
jgi:hypothetical protein